MSRKKIQFVAMISGAIVLSFVKYLYAPNHANYNNDSAVASEVLSQSVPQGTNATVSRVVDGDTIKVMIDGNEDTVRFIGINTPESVDPRIPVQCFGKEASDKMKSLAEGQSVVLVADPTQSARDKYHRLLDYVYLSDGTFLNQKMIEDGYAFEYTYDLPYQFQKEFKQAESAARASARGLWDPASCNYKEDPKTGKSGKRR